MSSIQGSASAVDQYWKLQFDFLQVEPVVWALDADSLMRSFDIIAQVVEGDLAEKVQRMTMSPPPPVSYIPDIGANAMMLGALAVEVLLKGIALRNQAVVTAVQAKDNAITKRLWTHDLRDIATLAGVQLSQAEAGLCERLETFLIWAGRYSTPKRHEDMMPRPLVSGGVAPPNLYSSSDFQAIRGLTARMRATLPPILTSAPGTNSLP